MKLTPQVETESLRAHEQVRAFERLRTWRLPACYVILSTIPLITGTSLMRAGHATLGQIHAAIALFFIVASCFHWRWLVKRYARNLQLLAEHQQTYGDQLPWVQVEKHMAALDKLKHELAEEKIAEALKDTKKKLENEPDEPGAK